MGWKTRPELALKWFKFWSLTNFHTGSVKLLPLSITKGQRRRSQRTVVVWSSTGACKAFKGTDYAANSEWLHCKSVISGSQEVCLKDSWVIAKSPVPDEDFTTGRITEILQQTDSSRAIVVIEQYVVQPQRHAKFNMSFVSPHGREETVLLVLKPTDIMFTLNVQHDCSGGTCKASGKRPVLQDRRATQIEELFIEHDLRNSPSYIINTASLHNPHLLRHTLPAALVKPTPLWNDRQALHNLQADPLHDKR
ncbi:hypothetical protein R3P38DRAFT_2784347 [Favolaschia claudopus]|uniref:Uncharacterized protein n=1 Tax=Favolaschia claudopus TaxID=2862362 RepID=A0AAW0AY91_9AGAR